MAVSNLLVIPIIPHCGLKEGIWSVECIYAPDSFPAQVSAYHDKNNLDIWPQIYDRKLFNQKAGSWDP